MNNFGAVVFLGLLGTVPGFTLPVEARMPAVAMGAVPLAQADAAPPVMPNPVLLAPGADPEEVAILQQQLQLLEVYSGPIDGDYSPATQEAVKAFQRANDLPATGLLDGETWDRMSTPQLVGDQSSTSAESPVPDLLGATRPAETAPTAPAEPEATESVITQDAAPESADLESSDAVEPDAPAEETAARRWRRLAVPGALVLAGILGLGLWWRSRHKRQPAPDASTEAALSPMDSRAEPPAAEPNGFPSQHIHDAQERSLSVPSPANGHGLVPHSATTRLPALNIVATLVEELASPDPDLRRRAIWELGQRGDSTAIQPLINGLLEADSQEKSLILAALSEISSRSLTPMHRALALGLQDPSPEVRKNAIRDLSRVYDTLMQLGPMLAHATQDPDPEVQATAQWALGQLSRLAPAPYRDGRSLDAPLPPDRLPPSSSQP